MDIISDSTAKADFSRSYDKRKCITHQTVAISAISICIALMLRSRRKAKCIPLRWCTKRKGIERGGHLERWSLHGLERKHHHEQLEHVSARYPNGKLETVSEHKGDAQFNPQYFTMDGKQLIYLTDEGSEFAYLASYDLASGEKKKRRSPWDIMYSYLAQWQVPRGGREQRCAHGDEDLWSIIWQAGWNSKSACAGDVTGVNISTVKSWCRFM